MSWKQLMLWLEFDNLEPPGIEEDLRAGVVAAQVANTALNFGWAKGERAKPETFFPRLKTLKEEGQKKNQPISREQWQAWKSSLLKKRNKSRV